MTPLKRILPLLLTALLSACIELPEVAEPEAPADAGTQPDGGGSPDGGNKPDSGVPADTTPPTITETSPSHNSSQVLTSTPLLITFSEPMDVSTVQVSTAPTAAFTPATWALGDTQVTLQPSTLLIQNTTYTLFVEGKDKAGNLLSGRKAFSFSTTGPAPDTTLPTVLSTTPGNSAIGIARDALITVVFSEPMNKASAQTAFAITSPTGFNAGVFDWNATATEMTFNPDAEFPHGTELAWHVSTAATDTSGNPLETTATGTFRVIRANTVTIDFDLTTSGSAVSPDYVRYNHLFNLESVGDADNNTERRLFLGFKLDTLPDSLDRITDSKLKWFITGQRGDAFGGLGHLVLERVYIGSQIATSDMSWTNPESRAQYDSPALNPAILIPSSAVTTTGVFDVTSFVALDWADRATRSGKRSQFRLRFEAPTDQDAQRDDLYSDSEQTPKLAELEVTYEFP
ncbi:Ig-like domain-containing protein [Hyalangium rubrum]|uniref:Ig-like domain-containing protein n=1 Tax=Hyalangium rubrum TaxID=3103134 RepID=A0ABU5HCJ4_9BACT|nr:Ig-like domain-containing protein [Hyalangium sp. s54d21]MDY7229825.1 Ig-like domain-containing protein [Hyalangium sp. s54d21]